MDHVERRRSYVWTILVLSWPAAFFLGFAVLALGVAFTRDEKPGNDLEMLVLETGAVSEKIVSGKVTVLRIAKNESLCYLTYNNGRFFSSSCQK